MYKCCSLFAKDTAGLSPGVAFKHLFNCMNLTGHG